MECGFRAIFTLLMFSFEVHASTRCSDLLNGKDGLAIVGPTTSGKTRLAQAVAIEYDGHVLNSDRLFFYRFYKIGTGRSDLQLPQERTHLFDLLEPAEDFLPVERFLVLLEERLVALHTRGELAIIEGVSSIYTPRVAQHLGSRLRWIGVLPQYESLRERIRKRVELALANGLIEEGTAILQKGLRDSPAVKISVVYPALLEYMDGKCTREEVVDAVTARTFSLVDEQMEWLKRIPNIEWFDADSMRSVQMLVRSKR